MSDQDEPTEYQKPLELTDEHLVNLNIIEDRRFELYKKLPCVLVAGPSCFNNGSEYYDELYFPTRELALQYVKKIHNFASAIPVDTSMVFSNGITTDGRNHRNCAVSSKDISGKTWGYYNLSISEEKYAGLQIRYKEYRKSKYTMVKGPLFMKKYTKPFSFPVQAGDVGPDSLIKRKIPFPKTTQDFDRCFILGYYGLDAHGSNEKPSYYLKHPIKSTLWDSIEAAYTGEYWYEYIPGRGNLDDLVATMQKFLEAERIMSDLAIKMQIVQLPV